MSLTTAAGPDLTRARSAAEAAIAVLPASRALEPGEPTLEAPAPVPDGVAVRASFSGAARGQVVMVVPADLVEALQNSSLGPLDLSHAVQPVLQAVAGTLGPVVLTVAESADQAAALDALVESGQAVFVPLLDAGQQYALVGLLVTDEIATPSAERAAAPDRTVSDAQLPAGLNILHDLEMEVTAELGRARMSVRDLLALSPGAVVELDRVAGSPADVLVNGRLLARGEVVVVDENYGIRITQIVPSGDRG